MIPRVYASPLAFKRALEDRLKGASASGVDFVRRRQLLVFDRFLARVTAIFGDAVILKGGLVLELRLARSRTTRDVDLWLPAPGGDVLESLQAAGQLEMGDYMSFEIGPNRDHFEIAGEGLVNGGFRYQAECLIAGRAFGQPFGVDVAFGDPVIGEIEVVTGTDLLDFAGVSPAKLRLYPVETHLAEKLHAYTLPRPRPNSRVKDLPDLALLGTVRRLHGGSLRAALERVFGYRRVQPLPGSLLAPPGDWAGPYARLAEQAGLPWRTLAEVEHAARGFLDPILAGEADGTWDPVAWAWDGRQDQG